MFSMCSELTPRARIPDTRIPQLMQPCNDRNNTDDDGDDDDECPPPCCHTQQLGEEQTCHRCRTRPP